MVKASLADAPWMGGAGHGVFMTADYTAGQATAEKVVLEAIRDIKRLTAWLQ
jgi:hypothetical protein